MNPRLEELLIWFLEIGQVYILVYGLVGLVAIGIIGILFIKDQNWGKSIPVVMPFFFMPLIIRRVFTDPELIIMFPWASAFLVQFADLFYFIPIILIGISAWTEF